MLTEAAPTDCTLEHYIKAYGLPTISFNLPNGTAHHWYPRVRSETPLYILNVMHDGTCTSSETVARYESRQQKEWSV
jgi:hypothetical protein